MLFSTVGQWRVFVGDDGRGPAYGPALRRFFVAAPPFARRAVAFAGCGFGFWRAFSRDIGRGAYVCEPRRAPPVCLFGRRPGHGALFSGPASLGAGCEPAHCARNSTTFPENHKISFIKVIFPLTGKRPRVSNFFSHYVRDGGIAWRAGIKPGPAFG